MDDVIRVDDEYYVLATSSRVDDRTRVLKHGETFAVFDRHGDIHALGRSPHGIFHEGTRFVSRLELLLEEAGRPLLLNSSVKEDNTLLVADLANPELHDRAHGTIAQGEIHLFRAKLLCDGACHEHLRVVNYGLRPVTLRLITTFDADYADIFEVRGVRRARRGERLQTVRHEGTAVLGYRGLDGVVRRTRIRFDPAPHELGDDHAVHVLELPPKGETSLYLTVACEVGEEEAAPGATYVTALSCAAAELERSRAGDCEIFTSNEQLNDWINRSRADLHMLVSRTEHGLYPYAGVPWFSTPFGRDGIVTALEYLWVNPDIARGVLAFLAATQATEEVPEQDAEPGKILHETRRGEMAALGEIPFGRYYGTVDATPLFVMLAGAYWRRTGDRPFLESIWPNIEAALEWIDRYGDCDGDGFVEYARHTDRGLVNQGWKDSDDAVFHADGTLVQGPVALCEVQGYVYAAKRAAAGLAELMGERARAERLRAEAARLRERFNEAFWLDDLGTYALALDGDKRPCRVRSSNAGHALLTGIADPMHARRLVETLLAPASFSGWGIRTIAEGERRYNPMSYHNGSIWPHDNALIAAGFARYGFQRRALDVLTGLFNASIFMDLHRLPELFCGFPRRPGEGPTLYPVACIPQAWAAATPFYLLQACLGLSFSHEKPQIRFTHPVLPDYVEWVEIRGLRVGGGEVDLALRRHAQDVGINVLRKEGDVEVAVFV